MHVLNSYDYALVRIIPSVERGECINVGVIVFCRTRRFLSSLFSLNKGRLLSLSPNIDLTLVQEHLDHFALVCAGGPQSGAIGELSQSERFHWLVSPRSTIIQTSPVHSGLCKDPEVALHHLFNTMVQLNVAPRIEAKYNPTSH
jgi:Protein of unknown function (DUF3037)